MRASNRSVSLGRRLGRVRNRTLVGGGVVIAVAAGIYFGDLFKGPGLGPGDGPGNDSGQVSLHSTDQQPVPPPEPMPPNPPDPDEPATSEEPEPSNVVEVIVDGRQYLQKTGQGDAAKYQPVELSQLVERAEKAPGDQTGVKIRVAHRQTAITGAIDQLEEALLESGLSPDAIHWVEQTVP